MTVLLFVGLSLVLAIALVNSRERLARGQVVATVVAIQRTPAPGRVQATVCRGKAGGHRVSEQVSVSAIIATVDDPGTALQLFDVYGKPLITILTSHIATAHGWIDGRLVISGSEGRRGDPAKPWYPQKGAWEVELVTTSGTLYRCAGPSGQLVESDLLRLNKRMRDGVLARAS